MMQDDAHTDAETRFWLHTSAKSSRAYPRIKDIYSITLWCGTP